jgi:formylglycine-generating enzyme required for sulfatase activity
MGAWIKAIAGAAVLLVALACDDEEQQEPADPSEKLPTAPEADLDEMVLYDAGPFTMGEEFIWPGPYGDPWFIDQVPAHQVTLGGYRIDVHEVTVAEFALFLTYAGGDYHFHPDQPIELVDGGFLPIAGTEDEPIRYVTWEAADHYCRWAGKRLPTEAEWERAATGIEGREYPWGEDGPNCQRAVCFTAQSYCETAPQPVGSRPAGATPDGVLDLAGNVAEWVSDYYDYYTEEEQTDPTGPETGWLRVVRGGGYLERSHFLRSQGRRGADPDSRSSNLGFRCAFSHEPQDGALRGQLAPPADQGRVPTDRPLAPAAPESEILAEGLVTPTKIVRVGDGWFVLDTAQKAVFLIDGISVDPWLIADGLHGPVDMVTDGEQLYVAEKHAARVSQVTFDGEVSAIAEWQVGVDLLLMGDGELFWARDSGVLRSPLDGTVEHLADAAEVTDLALTADYLYFAAGLGANELEQVARVPLAGGEVEQLLDNEDFWNTFGQYYVPYFPVGLAHDPQIDTIYVLAQKAGWPSQVELCELGGVGDLDCFAHSPSKGLRPQLLDGVLYWGTNYTAVRFDPADETYTHLGGWVRCQGLAVDEDGVAFTDRGDGRVYRTSW